MAGRGSTKGATKAGARKGGRGRAGGGKGKRGAAEKLPTAQDDASQDERADTGVALSNAAGLKRRRQDTTVEVSPAIPTPDLEAPTSKRTRSTSNTRDISETVESLPAERAPETGLKIILKTPVGIRPTDVLASSEQAHPPAASTRQLRPRDAAVSTPPTRKPRRTSDQVKADNAERTAREKHLRQIKEAQLEGLAIMEADEVISDMAAESTNVLTLADHDRFATTQEFKDKAVDRAVDDEKIDVEMASDEMAHSPRAPAHGSQARLDERVYELLAQHGIDPSSIEVKETRPKGSASANIQPASGRSSSLGVKKGLASDWRARIPVEKPAAKEDESAPTDTNDLPGGLVDSDAEGLPPPTRSDSKQKSIAELEAELQRLKSGQRDSGRRNTEVVEISSESEQDTPIATTKKVRKRSGKDKVPPAVSRLLIKQEVGASTRVKQEPLPVLIPAPLSGPHDPTPSRIPDFIMAEREFWYAVLYAKLFTAENPFLFRKHVTFVTVCQQLLSQLWPSETYVIRYNDELFDKSVARVGEKRGLIDKAAAKVVAELFTQPKYLGKVLKIEAYALWAGRPSGPGIFLNPTPEFCTARKGESGYIKPNGMCESSYFINTIRPFLKAYEETPRVSFGRPVALLGMAAFAVERQFRAYKKLTNEGKKGALNDFSKDTAASKVMTHMQSIRRFSDKRWASIYALCGAEQRVASDVDEDAMDEDRENLYEPSSD
ncbi:hypothetical protein FB107DRAFT_249998 [Schizophyllum commune]